MTLMTPMKNSGLRATALAILTLAATLCQAESARIMTWEDLVPQRVKELGEAATAIRGEFNRLSPQQRDVYEDIAQELFVRELLETGQTTETELSDGDRELLDSKPSESNPDAVAYWKRFEAKRKQYQAESGAVDAQLDGTSIRLPGYMLPLDFDGSKVREFLLVPYLGACIHSPPPPPNQIVHVQADTAVESDGLYTPVWIEGDLSAQGKSSDLSYVDGASAVAAGYSMRNAVVEPYKQ